MMFVFVSSAVTRRVKPGAIGSAVPGYELEVLGETGAPVPAGDVGGLVARGPTGALYWRDPARQRAVVRDGWTRVGDFVTRDAEEYVRVLSREADLIIKSFGYRIGPEAVEEALAKHPAVADVAVIGVADPARGQTTRAYVALRAYQAPSDALRGELIQFCRDRIAVYEWPREVAFVPQLPRAPGPARPGTGKLLRRVLREQAERI